MSLTTIRNYRGTFILDTRGLEESADAVVAHLDGVLKSLGAEVNEIKSLGRIDFTRVTDRRHTGDTYVSASFAGAPALPAQLHEKLRLDKKVKRLLLESI